MGLTVSDTAVTAASQFQADVSLRNNGGTSGTSESLTGSVFTTNHLNVAGTFEWQQDGTRILSANASRNLATPNALQWSNATETLTVGFDTSTYRINSSGTSQDNVEFFQTVRVVR